MEKSEMICYSLLLKHNLSVGLVNVSTCHHMTQNIYTHTKMIKRESKNGWYSLTDCSFYCKV